jgi:Histidine kinase
MQRNHYFMKLNFTLMKKPLLLLKYLERNTKSPIVISLFAALKEIWQSTFKKENLKPQVYFWLFISFVFLLDSIVLQGLGLGLDESVGMRRFYISTFDAETFKPQGIIFTLFTLVTGIVCSYINLILFNWMKHYDEPLYANRSPTYNFSRSKLFKIYQILFIILGYFGSFAMAFMAHGTVDFSQGILFDFGNIDNILNFATPLRQMPECLLIMWSFLGLDFYIKNVKRQTEWRQEKEQMTLDLEKNKQNIEMEKMIIDRNRINLERLKVKQRKLKAENERMHLEIKNKNLQLQMLKSRIKPHSFLNVLTTAFSKIDGIDKEASMLIEKLSMVLRYILDVSNEKIDKVTLKDDAMHIKNLVDLKKIYNSDLEVNLNIQDHIFKEDILKIEKGILDEFVLNAFKYGLVDKESTQKPYVNINLYLNSDNMFTFISENSTLITDAPPKDTYTSAIGLENVKDRLSVLYEQKHSLKINHFEKEGKFQIILKIELSNEN